MKLDSDNNSCSIEYSNYSDIELYPDGANKILKVFSRKKRGLNTGKNLRNCVNNDSNEISYK